MKGGGGGRVSRMPLLHSMIHPKPRHCSYDHGHDAVSTCVAPPTPKSIQISTPSMSSLLVLLKAQRWEGRGTGVGTATVHGAGCSNNMSPF